MSRDIGDHLHQGMQRSRIYLGSNHLGGQRSGIPLLSSRNPRCRRDTGYHLHPRKQKSRISLGSYHLGRQGSGISLESSRNPRFRRNIGYQETRRPEDQETKRSRDQEIKKVQGILDVERYKISSTSRKAEINYIFRKLPSRKADIRNTSSKLEEC